MTWLHRQINSLACLQLMNGCDFCAWLYRFLLYAKIFYVFFETDCCVGELVFVRDVCCGFPASRDVEWETLVHGSGLCFR